MLVVSVLPCFIGTIPIANCSEKRTTYGYGRRPSVFHVIECEGCIAHGERYTIRFQFTVEVSRHWRIEINGSKVANLDGVVVDLVTNATVIIEPHLYGPPGDIELNIRLNSGLDRPKSITRIICSRVLSHSLNVAVQKFGSLGKPTPFKIQKNNKTSIGTFLIDFGDGAKEEIPNFTFKNYLLWKAFDLVGVYHCIWQYFDQYQLSRGLETIEIQVYMPVNQSERYLYPVSIKLSWPSNYVDFYITSSCTSKPPTNAVYRINYGDGSTYTSWTKVPHYECGKSAKLPTYTYNQSGCFNVHFQMKNLLGFSSNNNTVSIYQALSSVMIRFRSEHPDVSLNKYNDSASISYLPNEFPFNVEAIVNASTCCQFEWIVVYPTWRKTTGNVNKITVSHLMNATKSYYVTVKVFLGRSIKVKSKRITFLKTLLGLILLSENPNNEELVFVYLLFKEPGSSTVLTFDFGDGNIVKEKYANFTTATNLPNIRNAPGSSKLDIASYKGLYKLHKYRHNGLFHVLVKASDRFRDLSAKRTVLVSNSACNRPKVNILMVNGRKSLAFSIGVTFTIQAYTEIKCGDSSQSAFKWEIFTSSKKNMKNSVSAEADKKIE